MTETTKTSEKLIAIGDALGRGHELPRSLRSWMEAIDRAELDATLDSIAAEHAETVQRAFLRIALARGWSPASFAAFDTLREKALAKADSSATEETSNGGDGPLPDGLADAALPDDEVVTAYITRGALARWVEAAAARNKGFAEELASCIDALGEAGEKVSDKARAWRKLLDPEAEAAPQAEPANVVSLTAAAKKKSGVSMYIAPIALAAAVVLVATGAFVFNQNAKQAEADRVAAAERQRDEERLRELEKLMKELEEQNNAIQIAQREAAAAKNEAERELAMAKLHAAQEQQMKTSAAVRAAAGKAGAGGSSPVRAKAACTCQAGDPLCSCL